MFFIQVKNMARKFPLLQWFLIQNRIRRRIKFVDKVLPKDGTGAELGVFKGQFSPILLKYTNATKLHLIDPVATLN